MLIHNKSVRIRVKLDLKMQTPKVCVIRSGGTNCDQETAFAFCAAGASVELVHIKALISAKKHLSDFQILVLPGGFTYGDDIAAGKIFSNELKYKLGDELCAFVRRGKLIIGICNGFQILVKAGLLPGNPEFRQEVSLIINDSGKFEDRWIYLRAPEQCVAKRSLPEGDQNTRAPAKCVWTKNLPEIIYLPVAHGEGKFVPKDKTLLEKLKRNHQIVFRYCDSKGNECGYPDNPNGSMASIAGICDDTGRIFGLMPHPERHISVTQHPRWAEESVLLPRRFGRGSARRKGNNRFAEGDGLQIFRNGVDYAKKYL